MLHPRNFMVMSRRLAFLASIFICFMVTIASVQGSPSGQKWAGKNQHVMVIDGDTLKVDGEPIHLYGIDCPEIGQTCSQSGHEWPCGMSAMLHLDKILTLNRGQIDCSPWGGDGTAAKGSERSFVCSTNHEDLADDLLRGGYCLTIPGAFPGYLEAEREARQGHLGIWGGDFLAPSEWRQQNQRPEAKP